MALQIAAQTQHFIVRFDDSIGPAAPAVANAVKSICEVDLLKLTTYMPSHTGGLGDPFLHPPIDVRIVNNTLTGPGFGGGMNDGHSPGRQSVIQINPFSAPNTQITDDYAGFIFVAEMSEVLMAFYGWDAGSSQGEALSRVTAEEIHPASSSNFVNSWLGWPRPRVDWIGRNEPPINSFGRGDLDVIAYGCGMIFIYFLRYQLNFSYDQICGAGGALLSDRYRNLTGATDDPAARVSKLLDDHFGTGAINLVGNNPFPLLEGADRKVFLAFGKDSTTRFRLFQSGHASIRPFFTCPVGDYPYAEFGSNVTQSITATTLGIGFPAFTWRINGEVLSGSRTGETVSATVDVPDPQNPGQPSRQTKDLTFDYRVSPSFDAAGGSSTLTLTSRSIDGDYQFDIQVQADETAVPKGAISATQGVTMHTRSIVYGGTYDEDRRRCKKSFEGVVASKLPSVQNALARLRNLPDPPQPGYLGAALEAAEHIREQLAQLDERDHKTASDIALYLSQTLGAPAHVFLKGARGGMPRTSGSLT
jgi:hypothetical protein